jgi:tRNA threonylcarbamoyladenosine biosynthesis protein TsaB
MTILAIDTATEGCSAALLTTHGLLERFVELDRGHSERILGMIDELLAESGVTLRALDAIAFGRGPGAFTGVRLAASITQGLAFGADRPVVPVSDLRAVAQRVLDAAPNAQAVLVCNDARMREVYWGCFVRDRDGLAEAASPERVGAPTSVEPPPELSGEVHGAGRGFRAYPALAQRLSPRLASIEAALLPRAAEVARIGWVEYRRGRAVTAEAALPVYLRDEVAQPPKGRLTPDA